MAETLCNSGHVKLKAGTNATVLTSAQYTDLINEAEGQIIADTAVNWIDIYPSMNDDFKKILQGGTAAYAAVDVVMNDPLAIGSMEAATTVVNKNLDRYDRAVSKLKEAKIYKPFGGSAIAE